MDRQEGGGIFFQEGSNGLKNQNINKFRPCVCVCVYITIWKAFRLD